MMKLMWLALFSFFGGIMVSVPIPAGLHFFGTLASIKKVRFNFKFPMSAFYLAAFCFISALSTLINYETIVGVGSHLAKLKYPLFSLLFAFGLHSFIQQTFSADFKKKLSWLVKILIVTVILSSVTGYLKSKFGFDLVKMRTGIFHERNGGFYGYMRFAYALQFVIIFFVWLLIAHRKLELPIPKWQILVGLVFSLFGLFTAETRGPVLALFVALPVLFLGMRQKILIIMTSLGAILLFVTGAVVFNGGSKAHRIFERYDSDSNQIRISQFTAAIEAIKEKPWLGHGINQFREQVKRIKIQYDLKYKDYSGQHAHNIFLDVAANTGILGFVFFSLWLICWLVESIRFQDVLIRLFFISFLICLIISGQVEYLFNSTGSFIIYFAYSMHLALSLKVKIRH